VLYICCQIKHCNQKRHRSATRTERKIKVEQRGKGRK
jgi:hypothetical protein